MKIILPPGMSNRDHNEVLNTLRPMAWDTYRMADCARELIAHYVDAGIDSNDMREYMSCVMAELVG